MFHLATRVSLLVSRRFLSILFVLLIVAAPVAFAADIMPLTQVHKGMRGYGLTVFEGAKLEKFDVEIIGILNNIAPGQSLIMARVDGPEVRRAGVIAGMSGSPVFIDGKVIGAPSEGRQFSEEPLPGITPLEETLLLRRSAAPAATTTHAAPP